MDGRWWDLAQGADVSRDSIDWSVDSAFLSSGAECRKEAAETIPG